MTLFIHDYKLLRHKKIIHKQGKTKALSKQNNTYVLPINDAYLVDDTDSINEFKYIVCFKTFFDNKQLCQHKNIVIYQF